MSYTDFWYPQGVMVFTPWIVLYIVYFGPTAWENYKIERQTRREIKALKKSLKDSEDVDRLFR